MKKSILIVIVAIVAVIAILVGIVVGNYNSLVNADETVSAKLSDVGTYLQRRADLIPNLVSTVKGSADYEQSLLTAVTEARSAAGKATTVSELEKASGDLDKALNVWVNAVTENYPELKANEQFKALIDELAGAENRIATARRDYNSAAQSYNAKVRKFPSNIFAGMFGFKTVEYFKESAQADTAPKVEF